MKCFHGQGELWAVENKPLLNIQLGYIEWFYGRPIADGYPIAAATYLSVHSDNTQE